jgi:membrane-associated protein
MFDLKLLIETVGYLGVFAIIFAETGLFFGFFLPGDSLLFTAGILASQGLLNIHILSVTLFLAAVLGDSVGYWFGHKVGRKLFNRKDSLLFHRDNVLRARSFYEKHGKKTIILARFIPIIRTFAPIVAGIGEMNYSTFLVFNITGGALWAVGIPLIGFFFGRSIPNIDHYLLPIIALIVFISILPALTEAANTREKRQTLINLAKRALTRVKLV